MPTTDLVWVVGGTPDSPDRNEMRYSARSFAANLCMDIRDAWAVGDVPPWWAGAKLPLQPKPGKFENQLASLKAYVNLPSAADVMVILNDDHFLLEPTDHLPICRNKSRASGWLAAEKAAGVKANNWHRAVSATASWVAECTGTDPYIYEAHVPLPFRTAKLREAINAYPLGQPFAVGELYPLAGAGGEGEHRGNAKVKAADSFAAKLANPMPYLSGNPDSWTGELGAYIRGRFDRACRWER